MKKLAKNSAFKKKTKIMAFSPITSWQIDGEIVETMANFIFLGFKITVYGDCSHEIKRHLLLGRKVMTNLASVLKAEPSYTIVGNVTDAATVDSNMEVSQKTKSKAII